MRPTRHPARRHRSCRTRAAVVLALCCLPLGSCTLPLGKQAGKSYHLILGLGLVEVDDQTPHAATVTTARSLGVAVSDRPGLKFSAGYSSSHCVSVPAGAPDVLIDASHLPGGPSRVSVSQP